MKRTKLMAVTIILSLIVVAAIAASMRPGWYLTLQHGRQGAVVARYEIPSEAQFSVGFIHSVNRSPFIDVYEVKDGNIVLQQCIYYAFGAGVETVLEPQYTLDSLDDGAMLLGNMNRPMGDNLTYLVGAWSDHTLVIGDLTAHYEEAKPYIGDFDAPLPLVTPSGLQVSSLSALCGPSEPITISCSYRLWK